MGRSALVVEDNRDIAMLFSMALEEIGFAADIVSDGQAALDHIRAAPPEIVVLDLNIPKVSGVEVLHRIRADDQLSGAKVVVVSANPHMIEESYDMADLVLEKPVSYVQLRDLLRRLM
jgi:DNA-binding response OmpR family regulator